MLQISELAYQYPHSAKPALDGISLTAQRGQVLGLLGPNGAGKTTLISHLAGLRQIQRGSILVDGIPLAQVRAETPTRIAVAPQEYAFYPTLSVRENLRCFGAASCLGGQQLAERIAQSLAFTQLERFADTRAERLSGGLKRRLNLAIALLPSPELVLFDEPTVGVDPQSRAFILEAVRTLARQGTAVIQHYSRHLAGRIHCKKRVGASLTVNNVHIDPSEWNPDPFGGPFYLQAIPGNGIAIDFDHACDLVSGCPRIVTSVRLSSQRDEKQQGKS